MALFFFVTGASALEFDVSGISSADLSKAKRLAGQFADKVDQAEAFYEKSNLGMAEKRLKNAERIYGKIIESYRLHPEVLLNKTRFDELNEKVGKAQVVANLDKSIQQ